MARAGALFENPHSATEMSGVFCESKVPKHESTCTWMIHDWKTTREWARDMKLRSKIFSSATNDGTKWCLEIHPMGATKKVMHYDNLDGVRYPIRVNYVSVYLRLVSVKKGSVVRAKFDLYVLNDENTELKLCTCGPKTINMDTNPIIGNCSAFPREYPGNNNVFGEVLNDKLKLVCKVIEYTDNANDLGTPRIILPECQIVDNFSVLFETKAFSDVKIIAKGNIEFEAHKLILALSSPVFAAIFKTKMREESPNSIEIIDTDPKVLEEMLRFIYTGNVSDIDKIAADLLMVADKYALQRLKVMCEEKLYAILNVENATVIFIIADRYNCEQLKTLTSSFISQHVKDVMLTEGYSLMIESYPNFAAKLLQAMFL